MEHQVKQSLKIFMMEQRFLYSEAPRRSGKVEGRKTCETKYTT